MKGIICRLLNILPGQEKNALIFAALAFFWSFACNCAYKYSEVLFLINVGADRLPMIYTVVSCSMVGLAAVMLFAMHRTSAYRLFSSVLAIGILFYLAVFVSLLDPFSLIGPITGQSYWLWYALRIFGYLFWCVVMTCFWTFIDQYHCIAGAKRHFCLYSASIFLGVASAGFLMRSGYMTLYQVLTLVLLILFGLFFWIRQIANGAQASVENEPQEESYGFSPIALIKEISTSRYSLLFLVANFVTLLLWVITEFNYMSTFEAHFAPEQTTLIEQALTSDLAQFLGSCVAIAGCFNIFFGLIFYSRLINRFGIGVLLLLCPTLFLITYIGWQFDTSLMFPLMGYFIVEGTLSVVDDNNFNLLLKSFHPKVKYTIRILTEYFFEPLGMFLTGVLISIPYIDNKMLGLGLSIAYLVISFTLAILYLKSVKVKIFNDRLHLTQSLLEAWDWIWNRSKCTEKKLLEVLNREQRQIERLHKEGLRRLEEEGPLIERLLLHADQLTNAGKLRFVCIMEKSSFSRNEQLLSTFEEWRQTADDPNLKNMLELFFQNQRNVKAQEYEENGSGRATA